MKKIKEIDTIFINNELKGEKMLLRQFYFLPGILKREWKKIEVINRFVSKMLCRLLGDINKSNPYYHRKFAPIDLSAIKTVEDLSVLPFTHKDELRTAFPATISRGYAFSDCIHESTSGSTGDILNIYHTKRAIDYYYAISFRAFRAVGIKMSDRIAYTRFNPHHKALYEYCGFFRRWYVPVLQTPEKQFSIFKSLNPHVIYAYPSILVEIGRLIEEERIDFPPPRLIVSHSELLTDSMREYISSIFSCPVYDEYSSFEAHLIASECSQGGMHIHMDNNIVEIIKDGVPVGPGERGEIVITNLSNRVMPFIRYRTGDYGVMSDEPCPCGRNLPLLKMIEGRKDEFLVLPSGKRISPRVFDPLDYIFHSFVNKFQIIQVKRDEIIIRVVKGRAWKSDTASMIKWEAQRCLPEEVVIIIEEVENIERTGRGKFRAVIRKVAP
jgi:phenylacetate-CoA ligase